MRRAGLAAFVLIASVMLASCRAESPRFGGAPEIALADATIAHDLGAVRRLLASGANPNPLVPHQGLNHSPWELALDSVRPERRETVEIVQAMLKAGADPDRAWGEAMVRGMMRRYPHPPLMLAMRHADPAVVRALMETGHDAGVSETALVMAVEAGETEVTHVLVENGVNVNCHPGANTPLTAAIETRNVALMTYLEEHGAKEKP